MRLRMTMRWRVPVVVLAASLAFTGCVAGIQPPELPPAAAQTGPGPRVATPEPTETTSAARMLHLTAAGDYDDTGDTASVLTGIALQGPDANLMLGDLSYGRPGGEGAWCSFVTGITGAVPHVLLAGNHESDGRNGFIEDFVDCLPPQFGVAGEYAKEYWVDFPVERPLVRIVMISPGIDFGEGPWNYDRGTARYDWTARTIDEARAAGIRWVVVGMHKPCLTGGRYECEPGADLTRMLVDKKVDLVLSGHEHLYQRSQQLQQGVEGCGELTVGLFNDACVADSDDAFVKGAGTVFVTVGTGGRSLRDLTLGDSEAGYFAASSARNQNPAHGFLDLRFTEDSLGVVFDNAGTGTFYDAFTITGE